MTKNNRIILSVVIVLVVVGVIVGMVITGKNTAKAPTIPNTPTGTSTPAQATSTVTSTASSSQLTGTVIIQKNYTSSSFSFVYPSRWSVFSISPFFMNNFSGRYRSGGIIPPDGAELAVVTTTISGTPSEIMATELMNATQVTTTPVLIDGVSCAKVTYQARYAGTMASQDIAIYCQRGNELWKIYLAYPAGDANAKTSVSDFNAIVGSMKLTR